MKNILAISACLILLACQQPQAKNTTAPKDTMTKDSTARAAIPKRPVILDSTVLDGSWYLQPVLASDTATGKRATIEFNVKKAHFSGNTGCNNMSGKYYFSIVDSSLSFGDKLVTTKMACTGFNEKAFLKNLLLTTHFKLKNGVLILLAEDNTELSRWERKPTTPANTGKA
ncbi:MAG TPA: META domain-containing protein [Puia sp.]|jgi:heat shock protein HslJ|nr:META domain-containing protein [Puia sp.]